MYSAYVWTVILKRKKRIGSSAGQCSYSPTGSDDRMSDKCQYILVFWSLQRWLHVKYSYLYAVIAYWTVRTTWRPIEFACYAPFHAHCDAVNLGIFIQRCTKFVLSVFVGWGYQNKKKNIIFQKIYQRKSWIFSFFDHVNRKINKFRKFSDELNDD